MMRMRVVRPSRRSDYEGTCDAEDVEESGDACITG